MFRYLSAVKSPVKNKRWRPTVYSVGRKQYNRVQQIDLLDLGGICNNTINNDAVVASWPAAADCGVAEQPRQTWPLQVQMPRSSCSCEDQERDHLLEVPPSLDDRLRGHEGDRLEQVLVGHFKSFSD